MNDLVSAIMLANDRPQYLERAIASVLKQDYPDIELIIVQDKDNTDVQEIIRKAMQKDSRIRYFKRNHVGNIAEASNFGIKQARGRYVAIIDDDDAWACNSKTTMQVEHCRKNQSCVGVGGGVIVIDVNGQEISRYKKQLEDEAIRKEALRANPMANSSTLFLREVWERIGGYDETFADFHDWDFWLRMAQVGELNNLDEYILLYTLWHSASSSANIQGNAVATLRIIRRHRARYEGVGIAYTMAVLYNAYAKAPQWFRDSTYVRLSCLKKAIFSVEGGGEKMAVLVRGNATRPTNVALLEMPSVAVVIPVLNEGRHMESLLAAVSGSEYPRIREILVVDGGSSDNTIAIVEQWEQRDARIKLLHNPAIIQSAALNQAFRKSTADVFLRMDAHCNYQADYITASVTVLMESGADNVGGSQRFQAYVPFQLYIALAACCSVGSGNARYRNQNFEGKVDTVFLGCFHRKALLAASRLLGGLRVKWGPVLGDTDSVFSEVNVINQDAELNARINSFGCVYQSRRIVVYYLARENWSELFKQYFRYGRGRLITSLMHKKYIARGNIPFGVLMTTIGALCVFSAFGRFLEAAFVVIVLLALIGGDAIYGVAAGIRDLKAEIWRGSERPPCLTLILVNVPLVLLTMNIGHALGFGYQIGRIFWKKRLVW